MCALVEQVSTALGAQKFGHPANKRDIITFVTRPMWEAFCRAGHLPADSLPTPWIGKDTIRVFVVESSEMWSFSRPI